MEYDKKSTIAPDTITSSVRLTLTNGLGNLYSLRFDLLENLPTGKEYDIGTSYIKLLYYDVNDNLISDILGSPIPIDSSDGYQNNYSIGNSLTKPVGTSYIKILSRLYLNNNTYFRIDKKLEIGELFVNTYFNLSNV